MSNEPNDKSASDPIHYEKLLTRQLSDQILQQRPRDARFPEDLEKIGKDYEIMLHTLREKNGVGIASNQCSDITDPLRMTIIGTDKAAVLEKAPEGEIPSPFLMINPKIVDKSKETYFPGEGCLSVLGPISGKVLRHVSVTVKYMDGEGKAHEESFSGFPAHIVQHEINHINQGLVFIQIILNQCSHEQKQEILDCIKLYQEGKLEKEENPQIGPSFDRDENENVIFVPAHFKQALFFTSDEAIEGLKKMLLSSETKT